MAVNPNNPPQAQEPVLADGRFSMAWYQWFAQIVGRLLQTASPHAPVSSNAPGTPNQLAYDQNYIYVYVVTKWKRAALNAW